MCAPAVSVNIPESSLHAAFLQILPRIETHARFCFRAVKCSSKKADRIAEVVGICWHWFKRLADRNKDAGLFPSALADFAVRAVKSGRRLCGQLRPNDVLSERAQVERGFVVESLPLSTRLSLGTLYSTPHGQRMQDIFEERLCENTRSSVPDQVQVRVDLPAWLVTLTDRDQRVVEDLALGHRTMDVARKYGISPGRVSQLREMFRRDWRGFIGDIPRVKPVAASA